MRFLFTTTAFTETCTGWISSCGLMLIKLRFKYIAILDIDEVIVPKKHSSWSAMMEEVLEASSKDPKTISWHFRHVYLLDGMTKQHKTNVEKGDMRGKGSLGNGIPAPISDIPEHLHMLNHIFRSANHSPGGLLH